MANYHKDAMLLRRQFFADLNEQQKDYVLWRGFGGSDSFLLVRLGDEDMTEAAIVEAIKEEHTDR